MKSLAILSFVVFSVFFSGCSLSNRVATVNRSDMQQNRPKSKPLVKRVIQKQKKSETEPSVYNKIVVKQTIKKQARKLSSNYNGSIKGVITNLSYNKIKKLWLYEIEGRDTSNGKLPYAKFYHYKKLANLGDFVYVILRDSSLVELYFIKKANKIYKSKKNRKNIKIKGVKKVIHKRDMSRKTPNIAVPEEEYISFD